MILGGRAGYSRILRDSETQKLKIIIPFTTYVMCLEDVNKLNLAMKTNLGFYTKKYPVNNSKIRKIKK